VRVIWRGGCTHYISECNMINMERYSICFGSINSSIRVFLKKGLKYCLVNELKYARSASGFRV
jgi:hypothetical protein